MEVERGGSAKLDEGMLSWDRLSNDNSASQPFTGSVNADTVRTRRF